MMKTSPTKKVTVKVKVKGKSKQKDNLSASFCPNYQIYCKETDCRNCKMQE